jgi:amidohydrolase
VSSTRSIEKEEAMSQVVEKGVAAGYDVRPFLDGVVAFYHDMHQHAELSMQEFRTQASIIEALADLPVTVRKCGGTGLEIVLRNGAGPVLAMRGDIDGLPLAETTGLPYASTSVGTLPDGTSTPVMHACGHDVHASAVLGALRWLDARRDRWAGTMVAVFQPGEETSEGALAMIEDGLFAECGLPDAMFGHHVTTAPIGDFLVRPGYFLAQQRSWRVSVEGVGGTTARPHLARDPIVAAAGMILRLHTIAADEVDPFRMGIVTVAAVQAGSRDNIIPELATFTVTARNYEPEVGQILAAAIERVVLGEAAASGVTARIEEISDTPAVWNDPGLHTLVEGALGAVFGAEAVRPPADPLPATDDFCEYHLRLGIPTFIWDFGCQDPALFAAGVPVARNHASGFAPHPTDAVAIATVAAVAVLCEGFGALRPSSSATPLTP